MKTIGLIGGMSWESSAVYYNLINELVKEKLGGFHSCRSLMLSVDFAEIELHMRNGDWDSLKKINSDAAKQLEKAGADLIVLCTNTMHIFTKEIKEKISIPFLHIAEATAVEIRKRGLKKVALLGTRFTMEKDFYKDVLLNDFGIEVLIPDADGINKVHDIIFDELVKGVITDESRVVYKNIIKDLEKSGAKGVILGCTEIPLLIGSQDVDIPVFDTTTIHARAAVEMALK